MKKLITLLICMLTLSAAVFAGGKEETVYARLNADGGVRGIYVVNSFCFDKPTDFTDYGEYSSVRGLVGKAQITAEEGEVRFSAGEGRFSYQGNSVSNKLPWSYDIVYRLDGRQTSAEELAGASGALEIDIEVSENVNTGYFSGFMQNISVTLDAAKCQNITAEGATLAVAGSDKVISFTVLGGSGSLALSADVTDFEMEGISIACLSYTVPAGISEAAAGASELSDAAGRLAEAAGKLSASAAELNTLFSAAAGSNPGLAPFAAGLTGLSGGLYELANGTVSLKGGIDSALEGIADKYTTDKAAPVSFVSEKNTAVASVGFVLRTDGIKKPPAPSPAVSPAKPTFIERFIRLFGFGK